MKEKQKDINFIGIIYEPWDHPEHPEEDITALTFLKGTGDLISEKITEEYSKEEDITAIDKVLEVIAKSNEDNLKVSQELSASIAKIANFISGAPSPAAPAAPSAAASPALSSSALSSSAPSSPSAPSPSAAASAPSAASTASAISAPSASSASPPRAAIKLFNLTDYLSDWINTKSGYGTPVTKDQVDKWLLSEKSQTVIGSVSRGNEKRVKTIVEKEGKITKEIVEEIKTIVAGGRRLRIRKTKKKNRKSNKTRSRQKRL
jgi:hypothetical protein